MAKDRERPDSDKVNRRKSVSSDELIKQAWRGIGRAEPAEQQRSSASEVMTSAANVSSTSSSKARELAAEEIAHLLREEEQGRESSRRPTEQPRRRAEPSGHSAPRPRRMTPIEVAPPHQVPHQSVPTRQAPPARQSPPTLQAPPARRLPPPVASKPQGQPQKPATRGRPVWAVLLAILALGSIVGRFAEDGGIDLDNSRDSPATTEPVLLGESTIISESSLQAGMCVFWLPPDVSALPTVPCAESHQYEVFAIVDSAAPTSAYGGPEEAYGLGFNACLEEFPGYVGEGYSGSRWFIEVIPPTESEWIELDDRSATCLLYQPDDNDDEPRYLEDIARDSGRSST